MSDTLRGRQIVLAGGSGGLGSASAALLAGGGADVFVNYRSDADRAKRLPGSAVQADITRHEDRMTLLDAAPALYGLVVFTGDPARVSDPSQLESAMLRSH